MSARPVPTVPRRWMYLLVFGFSWCPAKSAPFAGYRAVRSALLQEIMQSSCGECSLQLAGLCPAVSRMYCAGYRGTETLD